jgi:molybdopterin molybdotransferase
MRTGISLRRSDKNKAATMDPLTDALAKVLGRARPVEAIEVSLSEAVGLVLAEPAIADVDLPPFDRAGASGFAVLAAEAVPGALLRLAAPWSDDGHEVEPGESARVESGEPMPVGSDAVLDTGAARPDPIDGFPRVIEILEAAEAGTSVVRRGATLAAGAILAEAGTRIRPSMVGLFAAQGCVHPLCHRRVRVAILAIGEHLIAPADAPVLHHERNAANLAVGSLLIGAGAMVHDLGAVPEPAFGPVLDRALNAPVVLILGRIGAPAMRALAQAGVEPIVSGVAIEPGGGFDLGLGVVCDDDGRAVSHVLHLPLDPVAAVTAATLLVLPLISRLQGDDSPPARLLAAWDATQPATDSRLRAVPATLSAGPDARLRARPVVSRGTAGLPDLARADGLALFPPGLGPWQGGELIEFAPFSPWPGRLEG